VLLTLVGGGVAHLSPGLVAGKLTPRGRQLFASVARAVLEGTVPPGEPERTQVLDAHLARLDQTIAGFPSHLQDELSLLVSLLTHAPGRYAIAGLHSDWAEARTSEVAAALQGMRVSTIEMRRQVYQALRELTNAAYFADSRSWHLLGYPGPNPV
jgi:hypothetical protein